MQIYVLRALISDDQYCNGIGNSETNPTNNTSTKTNESSTSRQMSPNQGLLTLAIHIIKH